MSQHILTNVQYNESKQELLVEFSNASGKTVERIEFFPHLNFSTKLSRDNLEELLFSFGLKKFKIEEKGEKHPDRHKKTVIAPSFVELKKISLVLAKAFGKKPLIIEPERQFLLSKGWSYFDVFDEKTKEKISSLPENGFFLTKQIPFDHAIELAEKETISLVTRAAISNILSVKIQNVPSKKEDIVETMLENIYFKSGYPISFKEKNDFYSAKEFAPLGYYENISKIDFSPIWIQLFTNSFFNIGQETKNCSCCQPITLDNLNLYPDSMIEVIFSNDAVFYESSSQSFAKKFHNENPGKDSREQKKREFFMRSYPVGPFFKNQKALVPISDAKHLLETKKASLGKNHSLSWFCRKNESMFSKEITALNQKILVLTKSFDHSTASLAPTKDFKFWFSSAQIDAYSKILSEIPFQLLNLNSKFFSHELASSIKSIQEATIHKFREFSEKKGYRVLHTDRKSAFIRGDASLTLVKSFSEELSLPRPLVKAFSEASKLQ